MFRSYTKFLFFTLFFSILSSSLLFGQDETPIQNGNMEEWVSPEFADYEEPVGYWTTANRIGILGPSAPTTTLKETDPAFVHSGSFAAKMTTETFDLLDGILVTGTLATGVFEPDPSDFLNSLKFGVPFSDRPSHFNGHFMYFPVEGDSCDMYVELSRFNGTERELIGFAGYRTNTTVDSYTEFNLPIEYYSDAIPDSISIVCVSSAAGDLFLGQPGSTLYIDDLSLDYIVGIEVPLMPEIAVQLYPNPASSNINLTIAEAISNGKVLVYNSIGKLIHSQEVNGTESLISTNSWPSGSYVFQLIDNKTNILNGGTFKVIH